MATVSTACPWVAGRRAMAVTVPEKIVPAPRAMTGKPIVIGGEPGGATGKRGGSGSRVGGSATVGGGRGMANLGAGLSRPDWPRKKVGVKIKAETASRHVQLLPCMGRPQDMACARRN